MIFPVDEAPQIEWDDPSQTCSIIRDNGDFYDGLGQLDIFTLRSLNFWLSYSRNKAVEN